jgi:hypothetical protein
MIYHLYHHIKTLQDTHPNCSSGTVTLALCYYICVLILLYICVLVLLCMCPRSPIYVSSYKYISCVLILPYISHRHTTIYLVSSYQHRHHPYLPPVVFFFCDHMCSYKRCSDAPERGHSPPPQNSPSPSSSSIYIYRRIVVVIVVVWLFIDTQKRLVFLHADLFGSR